MNSCLNCRHLYIKDFTTGVCDNDKTNISVVQPDFVCEKWESMLDYLKK